MDQGTQRKLQLLAIVFANAIPLAGAEIWQWNAFQIIFLYWLESVIVGIYTVIEFSEVDEGASFAPDPGSTLMAFCLVYAVILVFYLGWLCKILGGNWVADIGGILKPFAWQIFFSGLAFSVSHGLRYQSFMLRVEKTGVNADKLFFSPFLRLFLVHALLLTSVYWIYYRHAALVYFVVTYCVKLLFDFKFHRWHEAPIPPVVKDKEFFGL